MRKTRDAMDAYVQQMPAVPIDITADAAAPPLHDAIVAFEVLRLSFARRRQLVWNPMMSGPLYEAWDRQLRWIASLHVPGPEVRHPPAFELRLLGGDRPGAVEVFLLVRASAPGEDEARTQVLSLAESAAALAPIDYVLRPLASADAFERAAPSTRWSGLRCAGQIAEVRRFECWLPPSAGSPDGSPLYAIHAWEWHLQGMDAIWWALGRYDRPLALCVNLSPMVWDAGDYACYESLHAARRRHAFAAATAESADAALDLYTRLLHRTPRPFSMRVTLVGESAVPDGLANAVGIAMSMPSLQAEATPVGYTNYIIARPAGAADLATARHNLERLGQLAWGEDLAPPPMRRWRYAVDARQAHTAFRLPVLPEDGYPGVTVGAEMG